MPTLLYQILLQNQLADLTIVNFDSLLALLARFVLHLVFLIALVRFIYYPIERRKDYLFTYILISIAIFLLCFLLESVSIDLAFALGLFAIFGIIRYRTDVIPIKEMTYLFIVIGMSVMNALINEKISLSEMLFANTAIVAATYGLEKIWLIRHETRKTIIYEKIELIRPEKHKELQEDIERRTGLKINRLEIGRIDFMRDTAQIRIFFYDDEQGAHMEDSGSFG
jgi:hypothetical protein